MAADYARSYGRRFAGSTLEGLREGKGSVGFGNGFFSYSGDWRAGAMDGRGTLTLADGSQYDGEFRAGEITGSGLRRWASGACYTGDFVEGEMHGRGTHIAADGAQYEGEWAANQWHGRGVLISVQGDRYTGEFERHRKRGVGTMHYASGDMYHGEWVDNERAGEGTLTFVDGATLVGTWSADAAHGTAKYTTKGGYCYEGDFARGVATGPCTHCAIALHEEPPSVLWLYNVNISPHQVLPALEGDEHFSVAVRILSGDSAKTPIASESVDISADEDALRWNGELLVDVPKGVRRPLLAKLELRHGDAVVAAGSAALEAPYASNSGDVSPTVAALNTLLHRDVGGEEEAIQLRLEYALALASPPVVSDVDPDGTGENFSSGDAEAEFDGAGCGEAPKEPPTIGAAAGYPMPPLQIRCLRGKDVEVSPAKVDPETREVEEEAKCELKLFKVGTEWGRTLQFELSASVEVELPADDTMDLESAQTKTWDLGTLPSGRGEVAIARLVAPSDAPSGSLKLVVRDATPQAVLQRLGIVPLKEVVISVEVESPPERR